MNDILSDSRRREKLRALHLRGHAARLNNDTFAARYNKVAADLAWSRTVALFEEVLA